MKTHSIPSNNHNRELYRRIARKWDNNVEKWSRISTWQCSEANEKWTDFYSFSRLSSRDDGNLKVFIFTNHEHENEDMS